jgi:DNA-binding response OmpR family regulator
MKKTILLADEDESVRKNLARVLELEQYAVITANCGSQASDLLYSATPDLALFDLELSDEKDWPGLDTLCDATPSVPIVLITARSHQHKRAVQLGADALMEKPLHLPLLLKTIRNLLREPKGERLRRLISPDFKTLFLDHTNWNLPSAVPDVAHTAPLAEPTEKVSF